TPVDYARAFARLENHYFSNDCFFDRDGQLLDDLWKMAGVRGTIVQGQLDMICPPVMAWTLHRAWTGSTLRMVPMAGHPLSDPGTTPWLVGVRDSRRNVGLLRASSGLGQPDLGDFGVLQADLVVVRDRRGPELPRRVTGDRDPLVIVELPQRGLD